MSVHIIFYKWVDLGRRFPDEPYISVMPKSYILEPIPGPRVSESTQKLSVGLGEADVGPVGASLALVVEEGEILGIDKDVGGSVGEI